MLNNSNPTIESLLASTEPDEIRRGLELAEQEFSQSGFSSVKHLVEIVSTLFYIDPLDRPELVPLVDDAISLIARFGKPAVPILVEKLEAGDLKSQIAIAHALGRIGTDAIEPLIAEYKSSKDPARRAFSLYALGKIKSPKIVQAADCVIEAAQSPDLELRDTATRAIGKFAESIPPSHLAEEQRMILVKTLRNNLGDSNPGIRAKAVRSLGKLAKCGHLTVDEKRQLNATCLLITGKDENFEWDRAYIVRKEAEQTLKYL